MVRTRSRNYSPDGADERVDRREPSSVQPGANTGTESTSEQESRINAEYQLPVVGNTRKRSHFPDCSDERGNKKASSSVQIGADPDTQSASVQEPRLSAEDYLPTVDNTRKRSHSPEGSDEQGDSRASFSVQTGSVPDTESARVQESSPSAEHQHLAEDNPAAFSCALCLGTAVRTGHLKRIRRCPHVFHQSCIDKWLNSSRSCPLCRTQIPRRRKRRPRRSRKPLSLTRL